MNKSKSILVAVATSAMLAGIAIYGNCPDTITGIFVADVSAKRTGSLSFYNSTAPFDTKTVRVGTFNTVEAATGIDVVFTQGPLKEVTIKARRDIMPYIIVKESGGTLSIKVNQSENDGLRQTNINTGDVTVTLSSPVCSTIRTSSGASFISEGKIDSKERLVLDASSGSSIQLSESVSGRGIYVESSSGASVMIKGCKASNTTLDASSGAIIKIESLSSARLEAKASSGASVKLEGESKEAELKISSGALFDGGQCRMNSAEVRLSSGARAVINAEQADTYCDDSSSLSNRRKK